MLSTCNDPQYRDGKLALRLMKEKISEHGADVADIDNFAAALAETGDYEKAAKFQEQVVSALKEENQPERLKSAIKRLNNYLENKPWRESSYIEPDVFSDNNKG